MRVFLYLYKIANRRTLSLAGICCGTVTAETEDDARQLINARAGDNGFAVSLLDVTEKNGEAFIAFPAGMIMEMESW